MRECSFSVKVGLILLYILCAGFMVYAQEDIEKKFPTKKLREKTIEDRKSHRPKEKSISYIYKTSTRNTLYGNPCALDVTRRWGFEYAIEEKTEVTFKRFYKRLGNNFGVKLRLFLTRGPWWKLVINKRFKDCRKKTGDTTG